MIMKYINIKIKKELFSLLTVLCLSAVLGACSDEKTYEALDEASILTEIKLNVTNPLPLLIGTDSVISYSVAPDYATTKEIVWSSDDTEIATVDETGRISAHKVGEVTIRARSKAGYVATAPLKVQVISEIIKVSDFTVTPENPELFETGTLQLNVAISPENATYKAMKWTSESPDIVSVSETGIVTGLKVGTTRIKVEATDGSGVAKTVTVNVKELIPVTDIIVADEDRNLAMYETSKLNIKVVPDNATSTALSWYSSDSNIISIDELTGVYTVKTYGSVTLTAKQGNFEKSFDVTVVEGKINDTFLYNTIWAKFSNDANTVEVVDGNLVVIPAKISGGYRAQIARDRNTYKTDFHPGNYPILALKITQPEVAADYQLDVWGGDITGGKYGNGRNTMPTIQLEDGTVVYYADLSNNGLGFGGYYLSANAKSTITNVIFGLFYSSAITDSDVATGLATFKLHWMKTFRSVQAMKDYLNVNE